MDTTDAQGKVEFNGVPFGTHEYIISDPGYFSKTGTITVESDSAFSFSLKPSRAEVKFKLLREADPVNNALVTLNDSSLWSDALGIATFKEIPTSVQYDYTINREGYEIIAGQLYLRTDTTLQIEMVLLETQVGNESSGASSLVFWPNPAGNYLYCRTENFVEDGHIRIMDAYGRIILQKIMRGQQMVLVIDTLKPGLY